MVFPQRKRFVSSIRAFGAFVKGSLSPGETRALRFSSQSLESQTQAEPTPCAKMAVARCNPANSSRSHRASYSSFWLREKVAVNRPFSSSVSRASARCSSVSGQARLHRDIFACVPIFYDAFHNPFSFVSQIVKNYFKHNSLLVKKRNGIYYHKTKGGPAWIILTVSARFAKRRG